MASGVLSRYPTKSSLNPQLLSERLTLGYKQFVYPLAGKSNIAFSSSMSKACPSAVP
jgi:hypothetical protein